MEIQEIIHALEITPGKGSPVQLDETSYDPEIRPLIAAVNCTNAQRWEMQRRIDDLSTDHAVYRTAVVESPTPTLLLDRDLRVVRANNAFTVMSGIGQGQLTGMNLHTLSVTTVKGKRIIDALSDNTIISGECIVDLPAGKKYLMQQGVPVPDAEGMPGYILVHLNDVTAARAREEEARKAIEEGRKRNEWFSAVLNSIYYPISVTDRSMNWTGINKVFADIFGVDRTNAIGRCCSATNGELCDTERCSIRQLEKSGKKWVSSTVERGDRSLKVIAAHITDAHGDRIGYIELIEDITALVRQQREAEERAVRLAESAHEVEVVMEAMAGRDFSRQIETHEDDPLKDVKEYYLEARDALRNATLELTGAIREISASTGEASRSVEGIAEAVEQIAGQSQKAANDSKDQLKNIEGSAEAMAGLSASVEEIAGTCQEVLQVTEKSAEIGEEASTLGQTAAAKIEEVKAASEESVKEIGKLNAQMHEINKIVKLITDISNQTNLLALNAAIEAARAGEHGRGFAVVAGEVRNLAGESKKATGQIEDLITAIFAQSTRTSQEIETSYTTIHDGIERVGKTLDALDQMVRMSEEIRASVNEIARATEDQANDTASVSETVEQVKAKMRANLKAIEEVAALIEEVSASAEEVGGGAQEVAGMATRLDEMIEDFTLE
ncbi:methyl-accepting chemotaxis protein [Methanofollis sp. W23]|uniref:methyl-accepting chemotaxis protein n=1 Tax=Methanofollis sp. W23 TaxID=2817849 RepID=UPI001AE3148B|nr:methyl-accepting chemotaxis protein [Methanofollis sp. W23]MBP2145207.1 methyl-accepting chemotaxis protein [Methanofollis sp. W23]